MNPWRRWALKLCIRILARHGYAVLPPAWRGLAVGYASVRVDRDGFHVLPLTDQGNFEVIAKNHSVIDHIRREMGLTDVYGGPFTDHGIDDGPPPTAPDPLP